VSAQPLDLADHRLHLAVVVLEYLDRGARGRIAMVHIFSPG